MKQLILGAILSLVILNPVSALTKPSCNIDPSTVSLGGTYTLTLNNAPPSNTFWVILTQSTYRRGHHPSFTIDTDTTGTGLVTRTTDEDVTDPLEAGWVHAKIYPLTGGNKTVASCDFLVQ